jgi:Ras-related protein Rap-1B
VPLSHHQPRVYNLCLPPPLISHHSSTTFNLHLNFNPTNQPYSKMSAPNANNPNDGIVGQAVNSVKNAANYVSESIQGQSAEASKEANKQQAKGNVPGNDSITDRASGAFSAVGDKMDQSKHDASAEANKRSV